MQKKILLPIFLLSIIYSNLLVAQCTLSASSSGGNSSYTQVYILTDLSGVIVAENTTGTFTNVGTGDYHIHALNYDPSNAPSPLPSALIGQNINLVGNVTVGCYNSDLLTDFIQKSCSACIQSNSICETDPLIATSSGGNSSYTQLYFLVESSSNLVIASNATGNFTGLVNAGTDYQVYALNYDPANPPSPIPAVGELVSTLGNTTTGCYNTDFFSDYVCYNVTNCTNSCFKSYNVCENENIQASSSGHNSSYTQVYVLTDNSGNFIAQNSTGIFATTGFTLGDTYRVYALNYNPANPPSPLPSALAVGAPISSINGGCFNADFLNDFVCYTIGCPCSGKLVQYAPQQSVAGGTGTQYTYATAYCDDVSGWRYYFDPSNPNDLLFSIEHKPTGGNTSDFTAEVVIGVNDFAASTGYDEPSGGQDYVNYEANFGMGRYWDVNVLSGSLNGNVNIRFYYPTAEYIAADNAASSWVSANNAAAVATGYYSGLTKLAPLWFKTNDATVYVPNNDLETNTINANNYLQLNDDFIGTNSNPIDNNKNYVQFDNQISSFSGGTVGFRVVPVTILDVEGLRFQGQNQGRTNLLSWSIDNDEEIINYELQRSLDAEHVEMIYSTNNRGLSEYEFVDQNPYNSTYYRLKMTMKNGDIEYSQWINLQKRTVDQYSLNIYPNPVSDNLTIEMHSFEEKESSIEIQNVLGQTVFQQQISLTKGKNQLNISMKDLPSTVYLVKISNGNQQIIRKITKS